jgi:hypothetical protein
MATQHFFGEMRSSLRRTRSGRRMVRHGRAARVKVWLVHVERDNPLAAGLAGHRLSD